MITSLEPVFDFIGLVLTLSVVIIVGGLVRYTYCQMIGGCKDDIGRSEGQ